MQLVWTEEALEQLLGIEAFIARDSRDRAAKFVDQLVDYVGNSLPDNPRLGRVVPEVANPGIMELLFRKYRIVYRLNGKRLEILTVFEGHRLLPIKETDL
jgi:plasmid stabilization system protein ParE